MFSVGLGVEDYCWLRRAAPRGAAGNPASFPCGVCFSPSPPPKVLRPGIVSGGEVLSCWKDPGCELLRWRGRRNGCVAKEMLLIPLVLTMLGSGSGLETTCSGRISFPHPLVHVRRGNRRHWPCIRIETGSISVLEGSAAIYLVLRVRQDPSAEGLSTCKALRNGSGRSLLTSGRMQQEAEVLCSSWSDCNRGWRRGALPLHGGFASLHCGHRMLPCCPSSACRVDRRWRLSWVERAMSPSPCPLPSPHFQRPDRWIVVAARG